VGIWVFLFRERGKNVVFWRHGPNIGGGFGAVRAGPVNHQQLVGLTLPTDEPLEFLSLPTNRWTENDKTIPTNSSSVATDFPDQLPDRIFPD
jgi:hypothetical protein